MLKANKYLPDAFMFIYLFFNCYVYITVCIYLFGLPWNLFAIGYDALCS